MKIGQTMAIAVAVVAVGCSEAPEPSREILSPTQPSFAQVPPACSTGDLTRLARSYFSNPEQRTATDTLRDVESLCASGNVAGALAGSWSVLRTMEVALEAGTAGSSSVGAALANGLMDYMCGLDADLCALTPEPVSSTALGETGIFAVRGAGTASIVARGTVPFVDFDEDDNEALWGLETTAPSWAVATGGPFTLFHGSPAAASSLVLAERSFGDLGYDLHAFPDRPGFAVDGSVQVGVCFAAEIAVPHEDGDETKPTLAERLQREGTVLQGFNFAQICPNWLGGVAQQSAFLGTALQGLRAAVEWAFLPQPLHAYFSDRKIGGTGGTPIDFSRFAPIAAKTGGRLVFVTEPGDGVAGQPLGPIRVQALSGEGTPMELVEIELFVGGNEGTPAGAVFCDPAETDPESCEGPRELTLETLDGYGTLAEFTDATLYKAGGYRICARALGGAGAVDFEFAQVCSGLFNLRN
jgi:hypothetical protein